MAGIAGLDGFSEGREARRNQDCAGVVTVSVCGCGTIGFQARTRQSAWPQFTPVFRTTRAS